MVSKELFSNNSSKNGKSITKFLDINEIRKDIESKFEYWMNWSNHGRYNKKTWNDNDSSTWVWNIDHIIPQSDLPYAEMSNDPNSNFQKCWHKDNLRPYSAKQNLLDGVRRTRHKIKNSG